MVCFMDKIIALPPECGSFRIERRPDEEKFEIIMQRAGLSERSVKTRFPGVELIAYEKPKPLIDAINLPLDQVAKLVHNTAWAYGAMDYIVELRQDGTLFWAFKPTATRTNSSLFKHWVASDTTLEPDGSRKLPAPAMPKRRLPRPGERIIVSLARKRPPGRPPGIYKYDQPTVLKTYRMTPKAHDWIKKHKEWIENEVRK